MYLKSCTLRRAQSKLTIVTTSWDDGDPGDLKIAELLRSRGLGGTFYVPIGYEGHRILAPADLRSLASEGFEVGAHGLSHHTLPSFSLKDLAREARICKKSLEEILGEEVGMFSYPKGRYSAKVVRCLSEAGYVGGRTTKMLAHQLNFNPFEMPTTVHAYPHPKSDYLRNLARAADLKGLLLYVMEFSRAPSWVELGKHFFDLVAREGGMWHLFGHAWEIEQRALWDDLKEMLDYVCKREGVLYLSNGEVLSFLKTIAHPARENQQTLSA